MYLVDTNVLSAAAPARAGTSGALAAWMEASSDWLFLSVVSLAEIEAGIAKLVRTDARQRAAVLADWLETVLHLYAARVLPLDLRAARLAGALTDRARALGHEPGFADIAIAATAQANGLTILTRNVRHFMPLGVPFVDPFGRLPPLP